MITVFCQVGSANVYVKSEHSSLVFSIAEASSFVQACYFGDDPEPAIKPGVQFSAEIDSEVWDEFIEA